MAKHPVTVSLWENNHSWGKRRYTIWCHTPKARGVYVTTRAPSVVNVTGYDLEGVWLCGINNNLAVTFMLRACDKPRFHLVTKLYLFIYLFTLFTKG